MNEKTKNAVYDLLYLLSCAVNGEAPDKARCEKWICPRYTAFHSIIC